MRQSTRLRNSSQGEGNGREIGRFPESFIPGFPVWAIFMRRLTSMTTTSAYSKMRYWCPVRRPENLAKLLVPTRFSVGRLYGKSDYSMGAMWCTNLLSTRPGKFIDRHRKLVATWAEIWPGLQEMPPIYVRSERDWQDRCSDMRENTNTSVPLRPARSRRATPHRHLPSSVAIPPHRHQGGSTTPKK